MSKEERTLVTRDSSFCLSVELMIDLYSDHSWVRSRHEGQREGREGDRDAFMYAVQSCFFSLEFSPPVSSSQEEQIRQINMQIKSCSSLFSFSFYFPLFLHLPSHHFIRWLHLWLSCILHLIPHHHFLVLCMMFYFLCFWLVHCLMTQK